MWAKRGSTASAVQINGVKLNQAEYLTSLSFLRLNDAAAVLKNETPTHSNNIVF